MYIFVFFRLFSFVFALAGHDIIDVKRLLNPCGFKQKYDLPCPTCSMTTAAISFACGRIFESFSIQPGGAVLCSLLAVSGFLALFAADGGVYFEFLAKVKIKYVIVVLLIIIAVSWSITLLRALALSGQG